MGRYAVPRNAKPPVRSNYVKDAVSLAGAAVVCLVLSPILIGVLVAQHLIES